ncbi:MAG: glycosyltransferase [Bacteroidaceae bacterium]|nr:glycosyltransferase [Bacteroidaceae bacterium]
MIFVRDKGQMCNNILQYAHVYAWAKEHHRPCMSMRFAYKYPYFAISTTPHHNFAYYLAGKFMARWGIIPTVSYSGDIQPHPEKEAQILASRNVMVEGWSVRHYSLFLQHLADIRSLFSFKPAISQNIQKYMESTAPADTVRIGVHIRRGDYQTWCDGKFYFTDEEYIATIRRALQGLGFPHYIIYICSNAQPDQDRYRQALQPWQVHFPTGNPGEDLCLLSECDYLIGPFSSFTLVATMYGKARLHWMHSHKTTAPITFEPFEVRLPQLDSIWTETVEGGSK